MSETAVWQSLEGVQAGQVFEVDGANWFGEHPLAAVALLDDLAGPRVGRVGAVRGPVAGRPDDDGSLAAAGPVATRADATRSGNVRDVAQGLGRRQLA